MKTTKELEELMCWMDKMVYDAKQINPDLAGYEFVMSPEDALQLMDEGHFAEYKGYPIMVNTGMKPSELCFANTRRELE